MKRTLITLIGILYFSFAFSSNEKQVKSEVKNVTVFLNSAQVYRKGNFNIEKGVTKLVFGGVSPYLVQQSIQAKGKGKYIILDVQYNVKYPDPVAQPSQELPPKIIKEINLLNDSIAIINFDIENFTNRRNVLNAEKNLLMNNKVISGEKADTMPVIREAMSFFREKLNDINKELLNIKREEFVVQKNITRMQVRLNKLREYNRVVPAPVNNQPDYQVIVTVSANEPTAGNITLNYMVNNAGWSATYDLRAEDTKSPILLTYKANVYQNTGENWDDVRLKLSTITPSNSKVKPYLGLQYLSYYTPYNLQTTSYKGRHKKERATRAYAEKPVAASANNEIEDYDVLEESQYAYNYSAPVQTMTNVEFDIKLPYSIPSDGKSHIVAVQQSEIPSDFIHFSIPKVQKEAFLIAKLTDWEKLDLLPGMANVYFEGTYIGETQLNASVISDTLDLALGQDRSIVVTRKKSTDEEKEQMIGTDKTKTITYTIKIKNQKSIKANLDLTDQIPLSQIDDIKISLLEKSGADYDEKTGLLKWNVKLNPNETKTIKFSYSVQYNKNKQLSNL